MALCGIGKSLYAECVLGMPLSIVSNQLYGMCK